MGILNFITWDFDPTLFNLKFSGFEFPVRWYGALFALGFILGPLIFNYIYKKDGKPAKDVDSVTLYVIFGTILGARLGHYLFYEWELLFQNPQQWLLDVVTPPFAGLASHGAAIGILLAIYLYTRSKPDQPFLWVMDRIVIVGSMGAALIRIGNLMNSEIYGTPTSLPWGFLFVRETDPSLLPPVPRHPTQLYEALVYLFLLALTFYLWKSRRLSLPNGTVTGIFMVILFSFRFVVEFFKNNQSAFENSYALNMGQLLSIPIILAGVFILFRSYQSKQRVDRISEV
jgi:phosphatidylglycerol:prolipoprotein diacylglycerol transferase